MLQENCTLSHLKMQCSFQLNPKAVNVGMKTAFCVEQFKAIYMELRPEHLGQLGIYCSGNFQSLVHVHLAASDKHSCYFQSLAKESM